MKKILLSLGTLVAVAAVVAGGTYAFYNDTETSTGNIFTAGSIDLKVDHTKASYNGEECQTCNLNIVSDGTTVVGTSPAIVLSVVHPAWTADLDGGHVAGMPNDGLDDGSKWIWITDGPTVPTTNQDYTFDRFFTWNGVASAATLYIATDNLYTSIVLNGNNIGSTVDDNNFQLATEEVFVNLAPYLVAGTNHLQVTVRNLGLGGSTPTSNPAGLLFKLKIVGSCEGGSEYQNTPDHPTCELWGPKDLDGSEQYFNFDDVKPGDYGRNLISLHVDDNDSYVCLIPNNIHNDENNVVDPELTALPINDTLANGLENGELGNEVEFFLWEDTNSDGSYQSPEPILVGPGALLTQVQTQMLAMTLTGGGATEYVGLAWCAGDQTLSGNNVLCDGNGMGDIAQTDKLTASLTAYAVQVRNNPGFLCSSVVLPQ